MIYRTLAPQLPPSSALLFGCSGLIRRIGRKDSLALLNRAFALGINHFDLARAYGYGEAEGCVGEFLKGRRREVVITTKFGLLPPRGNRVVRWLKPIAKKILSPFIPPQPPVQLHPPGKFDLAAAKTSVEKSLKELKTDYIDLLLMHGALPDSFTEEMLGFLASLLKEGKIRAYGAASPVESAAAFEKKFPKDSLFQFQNGIVERNHEKLPWSNRPFITYSSLLKAGPLWERALQRKDEMDSLGFPGLTKEDVYELMLGYTLMSNPLGSVISSMLGAGHLEKNIAVMEGPRFSPAQIKIFSDWVSRG